MRNRPVDAVVLGTSLFAAVALLGAAVSSFDAAPGATSAGLVGSAAASAAPAEAPAAPLAAAEAEQALAPFVPMDGADVVSSLTPMLAATDDHAPDDAVAAAGGGGATDDGHAHDDAMAPAAPDAGADGHGHGHDPAAPEGGGEGGHGHGGDVENATVIADGDDWQGGPFEGWRIQWEPAAEDRGAAMRIINENQAVHAYSPGDECAGVTPSQAETDYGAWLVARTHDVLQQYRNRPDLALADGYIPYPLGNRYWHMVNPARMQTNDYVAGDDPASGNPASNVLNPAGLESFIYGMVDGAGLVPLGGMYMYGEKDAVPPAPFGCLTAWHRHQGSQGFVTSFDPRDPRSVWMIHVWDLAMIGPWGEHDGTHASDWWVGWRYLPSMCSDDDCIA